jgi:hypothetical protein
MANGINSSLQKNGENSPSANLPMATFRHTGVGDAAAKTDYASAGQIIDGDLLYAAASGTNTYTATMTVSPGAYAAGQVYNLKVTNANTGAATINLNTLGAKSITKNGTTALAAGDIPANSMITISYDGTQFQLINVAPAAIVGRQTIWIPASAFASATTLGAAAGTEEAPTNDIDVPKLSFDAATEEYAYAWIGTPKGYNASTFAARIWWKHPATTANFDVVWGVSMGSYANDDALDQAVGTEVTVTDTGGTTLDLYSTPETAAITAAGTPAKTDLIFVRVARVAANGSDTLAVDADLVGVELYYTTDAAVDD